MYIAAHAVVTDTPVGEAEGKIYGTRTSNGNGLYEIDVVNDSVTLLKGLNGTVLENGSGYSNGLSYDPANNLLYFTAPPSVNVTQTPLWSYDINTDVLAKVCESLTGSVVGAAFYNGTYHYIAENTNDLMRIEIDEYGDCLELEVFENFTDASDFTFGDFAISANGMLYGSTREAPQKFFSLDLNDTLNNGNYQEYLTADALDLQLAYGSNGRLYGVNHASGNFYEVDESTGMKTLVSLNARGFSDLASGFLFVAQTESAWAGEMDFAGNNWATYFMYEIDSSISVNWNLSADVMPVPPYGTVDIPGSDTASKLYVDDLSDKTEIVGLMGGLNPHTNYTVYLAKEYALNSTWPGLFTASVTPFTFLTDEYGAGTWNLDLDDILLSSDENVMSFWVNDGSTLLISDNFKVFVD